MKTAIVTTIVSFCTALTLTAQDLPAKSEKPKDEAAPSLMPNPALEAQRAAVL